MAITFSCPNNSRYLRALGEAPRCIFSPQIDRIVELFGQEKDICFQSSIYYAKWTKLRIHCKNCKFSSPPIIFFNIKFWKNFCALSQVCYEVSFGIAFRQFEIFSMTSCEPTVNRGFSYCVRCCSSQFMSKPF